MQSKSAEALFKQQLFERQTQNLYRERQLLESAQGIHIRYQGKNLISFSSNNYLGLANHPLMIQTAKKCLDEYGVGSGSSYLISGYSHHHRALEEELADFLKFPRVLLCSSGYMANIGIMQTLSQVHDVIFHDKLNHASLLDGTLMAQIAFRRYPHRNVKMLEALLNKTKASYPFIVSEGVFGMDGTLAPLPELIQLKQQYNVPLMIDDAHGFGVLGKNGRGTAEYFQNENNIDILMGTFGKALGSYGAFIASDETLIENMIQFAKTYIYTTAIPPAIAAATRESLKIIQTESWRREKLSTLISYFRKNAQALNLALSPFETPIQPILISDNERALEISDQLFNKGLLVKAIRPPTVPHNTARLRISLTAEHEETQIDRLLECLSHVL